ncbi:MAG: formylglycine-generating enzyme family protein, partial [Betaproteobacteria bacterium]
LPVEIVVPAVPSDPDATVRIDAVRIDAAELARLEEREVVERAWREQEEYALAVAELKNKIARREKRRGPVIAAAIVLATAAIAGILYHFQLKQETAAEVGGLRSATESRLRLEEEIRAKMAAEAQLDAKAAAEAAQLASVGVSAAADAKQAAADKAKALALKIDDKARREAELAAKAQAGAMAQAEERARAQAAANVKEAPRAVPRPGTVFQDCPDCPRMVVIPAGEFTMGSPAPEAGRGVDEGPQRQVAIALYALGRNEVTVADFRRFADESGYKTEAERAQGCSGFIYADPAAGIPGTQVPTTWRSPGLAQAESHPVLCVSWNDARAYAQWLSKKTGRRYRLPSEAEWEYAARAGSPAARFWGDDPTQACRYANVADQSRFQTWGFGQKHECTDGHYFTAPAGGYAANRFGLHDMIGNVWEWTEDCWNGSYAGAPADGSAWTSGDCAQRVLRGGSWSTVPRFARSATRYRNNADHRDNLTGFRLARAVE